MKNKLVLIIEKSPAYLHELTLKEIKKMKYTKEDVISSTIWKKGLASQKVLFGNSKMVILDLSDADDTKRFADLIPNKDIRNNSIFTENWFGNGVIIKFLYPDKKGGKNGRSSSAGLSKIKKLVKEFNGVIIDNENPKAHEIEDNLLKKYKLNNNIVKAIKDYVSEDYDKLIGLTKALDKMTQDEIKSLSLQDLSVYLPNVTGKILPWETSNYLMAMNLKEALRTCDKAIQDNGKEIVSPIVILHNLKENFSILHEVIVLRNLGIRDQKEMASILGVNTNKFISVNNLIKMSKLPSLETSTYILKLIVETDSYYKGNGTIINKKLYLKNVINKIYLALKFNAPLEK